MFHRDSEQNFPTKINKFLKISEINYKHLVDQAFYFLLISDTFPNRNGISSENGRWSMKRGLSITE